jgi:5-(carboxyamino)imidazole ribonucleotide mutase
MPRGVPVATVAINGATNAGLLCVRILAAHDEALGDALEAYRLELADQAKTQDEHLPRT